MELTRRNFVASAAAATAAMGIAGTAMADESSSSADTQSYSQTHEPPTWGVEHMADIDWLGTAPEIADADIVETRETDLLIIGAGNAGMVAAATASDAGMNFEICEKTGLLGTTRNWYGVCNSTQCKEAGKEADPMFMLNELTRYANGKVNQKVIKNWIDNSAEMSDWLVNIMDGYVQINAKNVLLTTGGYAGNYEMLEALNPLLVRCTTAQGGWTFDTGMGIKAAMWVGAEKDVEPAGMIWDRGVTEPGTPCGFVRDEETGGWKFPHEGQFNPASQPFLRVNAEGERFMNESGPYDWNVYCSSQQTYGTWNTVWDANFCDDVVKFDKLGCASLTIILRDMFMQEGGTFDQMAEEGTLVKADTLEELAEGLNIPVDTFLATVERYNEIAESGVDEDFGKEDYRLSTLKTPPFYGVTCGGTILCTGDGIKINEHMQVKDTQNKVIEGLYAAGDCSGSFFSGVYPELFPGLACGRTMTEARQAVKFIAGE